MAKKTTTKKSATRKASSRPAAKAAHRPSPARSPGPAGKPTVIKVQTPPRRADLYQVSVGSGLLPSAAEGLVHPGQAVLVVIDSHLGNALVEPLLRSLDRAKVRWGVSVVPASEADKSLATAQRALAEAGRIRLGRDGLIIGVGGGIVTDIAGFVASVFKRGVRVIQCPTTLLAMVDAAVGGKTAVNLAVPAGGPGESDAGKDRLIKNAVGVFHQPARVVCDVAALQTLPRRELRCGLAECLKHGLIAAAAGEKKPAELFEWTVRSLPAILDLDEKKLVELVSRNVALKARVVARDPFEESTSADGGRMMLNLGHTFAHALETLPGLSWADPSGQVQIGPLKHGEAVGLGLLAALRLSERLKLLRPALSEHLHVAMHRIGLPTAIRGLPPGQAVVERMLDDKKNAGGRLRLVLPVSGYRTRMAIEPAREAVLEALESLRT